MFTGQSSTVDRIAQFLGDCL